jgi:hypothetical protein
MARLVAAAAAEQFEQYEGIVRGWQQVAEMPSGRSHPHPWHPSGHPEEGASFGAVCSAPRCSARCAVGRLLFAAAVRRNSTMRI